jgi:NCS1 family nucleobase:cation symporter-1
MDEGGKYWYSKGYNRVAVLATAVGAVLAVIPVLLGGSVVGMHTAAQYSWFIGCGVAFAIYALVARRDALVAESVS